MSLETLLSALSDGEFHSGDALGRRLGVSRTAIWKQLKKVEALNLPLISIKGKGYQIEGGLDLLDKQDINSHLTSEAQKLITQLDVMSVVESTNQQAMMQAVLGNSGYVCTAEQQTAGRGRHGRNWISPYGSNLYVSITREFANGVAALEGLSLAVGVTVVEALAQSGIKGLQLKWPNDVLHQQRKMAGILLEITGHAAGPCQVVIGLGLNVKMPADAGKTIDQPWTDINQAAEHALPRNQLLALLLNQLMPMLNQFDQHGFSAFRDRWQSLDAFAGKEVQLTAGNQVITGRVEGVDDLGAIVMQTDSGKQSFSGGELSLREIS